MSFSKHRLQYAWHPYLISPSNLLILTQFVQQWFALFFHTLWQDFDNRISDSVLFVLRFLVLHVGIKPRFNHQSCGCLVFGVDDLHQVVWDHLVFASKIDHFLSGHVEDLIANRVTHHLTVDAVGEIFDFETKVPNIFAVWIAFLAFFTIPMTVDVILSNFLLTIWNWTSTVVKRSIATIST